LRPRRKSDEEELMKNMSVASFCAVIAGTVILTLVFSATVLQPKAAAAPAVGPMPVAAATMAPVPPHPHIHEALDAMHAAKHHLEQAEHDYDGHRAKAIEHLDMAIHEAEICMSMP